MNAGLPWRPWCPRATWARSWIVWRSMAPPISSCLISTTVGCDFLSKNEPRSVYVCVPDGAVSRRGKVLTLGLQASPATHKPPSLFLQCTDWLRACNSEKWKPVLVNVWFLRTQPRTQITPYTQPQIPWMDLDLPRFAEMECSPPCWRCPYSFPN